MPKAPIRMSKVPREVTLTLTDHEIFAMHNVIMKEIRGVPERQAVIERLAEFFPPDETGPCVGETAALACASGVMKLAASLREPM